MRLLECQRGDSCRGSGYPELLGPGRNQRGPEDLQAPQGCWSILLVVESLSHVDSFATLWTVAQQAPLHMGFSRQAYWSGFPFPSPGDLPESGIKHASPALAHGFPQSILPGPETTSEAIPKQSD